MAHEAIVWPEGAIYLYTGTATTSALIAYASDVNATLARGWNNYSTLDDVYHDVLTGRRADLTIGNLYTVGNSALRAFEAAHTAVHIHLYQSGVWGSAGYHLYSGRIDRVTLVGREGDVFRHQIAYHANEWSAY
jgi:hypothetical protein